MKIEPGQTPEGDAAKRSDDSGRTARFTPEEHEASVRREIEKLLACIDDANLVIKQERENIRGYRESLAEWRRLLPRRRKVKSD